jgi:hypothetical protein
MADASSVRPGRESRYAPAYAESRAEAVFMKLIFNIIAAAAILFGCVWILQGLNILPGSAMSGHVQWTGRGAALLGIGFFLLVWTNFRKTKA